MATTAKYTDKDKADIADILGGKLTRDNVRKVAARFHITFNAAVGISWRVLNPHQPTISPRRLAKQLREQAFADTIRKLSRRFKSRRPDGHGKDKMTLHERRMATWLRNRGHDARIVGGVLNIDARIVAGYFTGCDSRNRPRYCKRCRVRLIPKGRHFYCSDACAQAVIKDHHKHYHKTRKRKKSSRRYYMSVKHTPEFKAKRKACAEAYKQRPEVKARRLMLFHTRDIARERQVPHTQVLRELGVPVGRALDAIPMPPRPRKPHAKPSPTPHYRHYTPDQDRLIMAKPRHEKSGYDRELAHRFGRTVESIWERRRYLRALLKSAVAARDGTPTLPRP